MSSGFSKEQVEAVAALANHELSEQEIELFSRQLGDILKYADQVQQIDTTGVAPTASVALQQSDRADDLVPSLERGRALANAPDPHVEAGLFKVPRVIG
jgi:aspartyl-tRNA(Asn)/glutamyl-tRNA(Gln) amidotransferase subunit C